MKLEGINASSRKTINAIKNAFAELLEEKKEINNITVTELVKRANLTRGAFYSHYDSIYDVAQDMESELQEIALSNLNKLNGPEDINNYLDYLFDYLEKNKDLYRKLLKSNDSLLFLNRFSNKIFNVIKSALNIYNNNNIDIKLTFYTNGAVMLLIKYFREETLYSLDEIKSYLKDVFVKIFN